MNLIYTKPNCPFCVKAKALLKEKGIEYREIEANSKEVLRDLIGKPVSTVPQIMLDEVHVGGYTDLVEYLARPTRKTVFNTENRGHIEGSYPLFLGPELGLTDTINQPYPVLEKLYDMQMGQIWNHEEIDLTQDRQDMISADPKVVELMVKTISWQWLADSIASRSITGVLMEMVSNSDLESLYNAIALFETIHSKTYSHIVKQTFIDPTEAIRQTYADMSVIKRSNILRDTFDELCNVPYEASIEEKKEKLYPALVALYMLESLNFMASFAITFGIAETGIFQGISQDVVLICRDEMLHGRAGAVILGIEKQNNPEFFQKDKMQALFDAVLQTELEWTDHLFSEGRQCPGINANRIKRYVKYMAQPVAKTLGLDCEVIEENPLPYMDAYIDSSKTQIAAQELQLTSYLVNAVKAPIALEATLTELREEFS